MSPDIIRGQKVSDIPGTGTAGCFEPPNVGTNSGPLEEQYKLLTTLFQSYITGSQLTVVCIMFYKPFRFT